MPGPGVYGAAGIYGQVQGRICPAPTALQNQTLSV